MRDIRQDLMERLTSFREERQRIMARYREIEVEENTLKVLLDIESRRFPGPLTVGEVAVEIHPAATSDLRRIVLEALSDGKPRRREELTKAVEEAGIKTAGALGRSVQGTLLSLKHQEIIKLVDDGVWQMVK